MMPVDV